MAGATAEKLTKYMIQKTSQQMKCVRSVLVLICSSQKGMAKMMKINLIKPKYIGKMGLPGKEVRLFNIGRRTHAEQTIKEMGTKYQRKGGEIEMEEDKTVPCRICTVPTPMLGTKLCDRCWELETRIHADLILARRS